MMTLLFPSKLWAIKKAMSALCDFYLLKLKKIFKCIKKNEKKKKTKSFFEVRKKKYWFRYFVFQNRD